MSEINKKLGHFSENIPRQRGTRMSTGLTADFRLAIRMITRQPWSALAIAGTLALGIGATTAIYAVFNYVLFRPVPGVSDDATLITVTFRPPGAPNTTAYGSPAGISAMRAAGVAAGLVHLGFSSGSSQVAVTAPAGNQPTFEGAEFVSSQFFEALGVRARLGGLFTQPEADGGSQDVAVISDRLWRTSLNQTPSSLGQTISVNGHPFVI